MASIYPKVWYWDHIVDSHEATLHVGSAAVLYGLSVYTVFPLIKINDSFFVFRIADHLRRLQDSARMIGIDLPVLCQDEKEFLQMISRLIDENRLTGSVFARATIHVDALVPGTKSRGLSTCLSIFLYEMNPIVPQTGCRLKTSVWRRNPDFCIPSRAKVNSAYVNSVLAKQDALDSGYDDAIFLDIDGHVCELSAANIFLVRNKVLITPSTSSDILEGINRRTILEIARDIGLQVEERIVDLTELYIADEVFVSGTSAFITPVTNIDGRIFTSGTISARLRDRMRSIQKNEDSLSVLYMKEVLSSLG